MRLHACGTFFLLSLTLCSDQAAHSRYKHDIIQERSWWAEQLFGKY